MSWVPEEEVLKSNWFKASQALSQSALTQGKLNKTIRIKQPGPKSFSSDGNVFDYAPKSSLKGASYSGSHKGSKEKYFEVPPLNAIIGSAFGKAANPQSSSFKLFSAPQTNLNDLQFLNWASIRKGTFDDPNKHRNIELKRYKIGKVFNQLCCGACWAVSTAGCFADRYGIANDEEPIEGSIISIMTCCTREMKDNVFSKVATPDCSVMSTYNELGNSNNSMGMCSGGIPYSAAISIKRNGLPKLEKPIYTETLFDCKGVPSLPNLNQSIISKFPCGKEVFDSKVKIKMDSGEDPVYISSALDSKGHPEHYVKLMKEALLEGGPLVGGFMVLGDFLGIGTTSGSLGASSQGDNDLLSWDSTGKVYVPGAYDTQWPFIPLTSVGGSTTIQINSGKGNQTKVFDTGLKPKAAPGQIFCGFHAITIVGWGELDMKYVKNTKVKSIKSLVDGRQKLPFWICRNSWGTDWPMKDGKHYYEQGIKVTVGSNSQEKILNLPPGYWLHAMYPNESVALDAPINYEGTDYGSTMVMVPQKSPRAPGPTKKPMSAPVSAPVSAPTGILFPSDDAYCDSSWRDSEGFSCKQYVEQGWCTYGGKEGPGWKSEWGSFKDFANDGKDASMACCECGAGQHLDSRSRITEISFEGKKAAIGGSLGGISLVFAILLVWLTLKQQES